MSPSKQHQHMPPSNRLFGSGARMEIGGTDYIPDEPFARMPALAAQHRRQHTIDTVAEHMATSLIDDVLKETAACALLITRAAAAADACTSAAIDEALITPIVASVYVDAKRDVYAHAAGEWTAALVDSCVDRVVPDECAAALRRERNDVAVHTLNGHAQDIGDEVLECFIDWLLPSLVRPVYEHCVTGVLEQLAQVRSILSLNRFHRFPAAADTTSASRAPCIVNGARSLAGASARHAASALCSASTRQRRIPVNGGVHNGARSTSQ